MPADATILNMILNGDDAAANAALEAGHPAAFLETVRALVELVNVAGTATSGSSQTIGTGAKAFTLDQARGWRAGTPVYIMEDGDPQGNFMVGTLSADEDEEEIAVDVTAASGSGTFSAWTIIAILATTNVVSPPLAVADGGTGGTTSALARQSLQCQRTVSVLDVVEDDPGGTSTGDRYLVGAGTGTFAGHDNKIATDNGAGWTFETPAIGDVAFDMTPLDFYVYLGVDVDHTAADGLTKWRKVGWPGYLAPIQVSASYSLTVEEVSRIRTVLVFDNSTPAAQTATLPNTATDGSEVTIINASAQTVAVNVSGGQEIDGAASVNLAAGTARRYVSFSGDWYTL